MSEHGTAGCPGCRICAPSHVVREVEHLSNRAGRPITWEEYEAWRKDQEEERHRLIYGRKEPDTSLIDAARDAHLAAAMTTSAPHETTLAGYTHGQIRKLALFTELILRNYGGSVKISNASTEGYKGEFVFDGGDGSGLFSITLKDVKDGKLNPADDPLQFITEEEIDAFAEKIGGKQVYVPDAAAARNKLMQMLQSYTEKAIARKEAEDREKEALTEEATAMQRMLDRKAKAPAPGTRKSQASRLLGREE